MTNSDTRNDQILLEIIVPTYQRSGILRQNLEAVADLTRREGNGQIAIRVRDNASTDGTAVMLREFAAENEDLRFSFCINEENVGLEANCLTLLEESDADHIMFLGDDDFLPDGYLRMVLDQLKTQPETGVIISGYSDLMPGGEVRPSRFEDFERQEFVPGTAAMFRLMPLGHQLSGLVFKTDSLARDYLDLPDHGNLYPFIYFVGNRCRKYPSVYAPVHQQKVSVAVKKYWDYDRSALLRHVLTNYDAVFAGEPVKRMRGQMAFMCRNWDRIGGANILRLPSAFTHVVCWRRLDWLTRFALIICLPWLVGRALWYSALKVAKRIRIPQAPQVRRLGASESVKTD